MYLNDDPKFRIQATVMDIISYDTRHIRVDKAPILNKEYSIVLNDSICQAERYALYIMNEFKLIDFVFPKMPPAPTISANIQKLVSTESLAQFFS